MPGVPGVPSLPGIPSLPLPGGPPSPPPIPSFGDGIPWLPANAGIMWWQGATDPGVPPRAPSGETGGALWLTRRLAVQPFSDVQHVGSLFHGIYVSVGGGAWVAANPGCLLPQTTESEELREFYRAVRAVALAASGLDGCGIEGIAYDPLLQNRVYATGYEVAAIGDDAASLEPGGIYVSDDLGFHWRKLAGGFRGNGLAVARTGDGRTRILTGFIQRNNGDVGATPGNGSMLRSENGGQTWSVVTLPPSGCDDIVFSSQRITATIVIHPDDPDRIYAGTNAGLYVSASGGATWRLAHRACGGTWGLGLSPDGDTLYIGDHEGRILRARRDGTVTGVLADLGGGRVQDVQVSPRGDRLWATIWDGAGSIFRVATTGGDTDRLATGLLSGIDAFWPRDLPQPFPFGPTMGNGSAPALFLSKPPGRLMVSTFFRGVFVRFE